MTGKIAPGELMNEVNALTRERDELRATVAMHEINQRNLTEQLSTLIHERDELRATVTRLRAVITELQQDVERLQQQRAEQVLKNERMRAALEWVRDDTELWDAPIVLDALAGAREDEPEQAHRSETASP